MSNEERENVVDHSDKGMRGKNGKYKFNDATFINIYSDPWYIQSGRLVSYTQDQREYILKVELDLPFQS